MSYQSRLVPVLLLGALTLGGCASQAKKPSGDALASVKAMAEKAAADAAAARREAAEAKAMAARANSTANAAKAQSEKTEAKIDRMFKKAMYK